MSETKYPEVYGITGKRGHGKDTLAKEIQKHNDKFAVIHFAAPLKELCMKVFGLSHSQVWTEEGKECPLPSRIQLDLYVSDLREATGLEIAARNKTASTAREILQYVGTDYVRSVKDSYWIDQVHEKIKMLGGYVLIPDTRFENEAEFLESIGAQIVKVEREGLDRKGDQASQHSSETSIDQIRADWCVKTTQGNLVALQEFAKLLATGKLPQERHDALAKKQLETIVAGFNQAFGLWEEHWKCGANINVDYHSQPGKKLFYVGDVASSLYHKPVESSLQQASDTIQAALKDGLFDKAMEKVGEQYQAAAHP